MEQTGILFSTHPFVLFSLLLVNENNQIRQRYGAMDSSRHFPVWEMIHLLCNFVVSFVIGILRIKTNFELLTLYPRNTTDCKRVCVENKKFMYA